ncbi:MAG: acetyltransferase [bacterium]|nr:acetyltransferase [bacterium]
MRSIIIIGASGHGRVALDIVRTMGREAAGFVDLSHEPGGSINGTPVLAREPEDCADLRSGAADWFVAIGNNKIRRRLTKRCEDLSGRKAVNLIHPSAVISERIIMGSGVFIAAGTVVGTDSVLGDGVIVNTGATVDHDNRLESWAQVCPGCHLAGNVTLEESSFLGTAVAVTPGKIVGQGAQLAAGSVVRRDIPELSLYTGNPAIFKKSLLREEQMAE